MAKGYSHFTLSERTCIKEHLKAGKSTRFIAAALHRARSSISDEIKRNKHNGSYEPKRAQSKAEKRRQKPRRTQKMDDPIIAAEVKAGLAQQWSPEQIAGRMKRAHPHDGTILITFQSIYRWLEKDKSAGGVWYQKLRINNRKRKRSRTKKSRRARIADRVMIDQRPASVDSKRYFGDWEGDTVEGKKGQGRLATMVERKTLYTLIAKVPSKRAEHLNSAVIQRFCSESHLPRRTLTVDNGLEFSGHKDLAQALKIDIYFARPHHSWERGLNENTNGLLRQYFPKGYVFHNIPEESIEKVETLLNNRPRKTLGYRTPAEVMALHVRRACRGRLRN